MYLVHYVQSEYVSFSDEMHPWEIPVITSATKQTFSHHEYETTQPVVLFKCQFFQKQKNMVENSKREVVNGSRSKDFPSILMHRLAWMFCTYTL